MKELCTSVFRYFFFVTYELRPDYVTENDNLQERWKILKTWILQCFFEAIDQYHYQETVRPLY